MNVTEVRSFLGFAGYYRPFIPHFAQIAAPLTNLARENTPFTWNLREGEAFKALKDVLQHAPIMVVNLCTCTNEPSGEDLCARSVIG